jgi:hypothetical protein
MRTLKDREKVLYAPFSNVGALNFEKSSGYITIPDSQVIYTRVGGGDANGENNPDEKDGGIANAQVQSLTTDFDHGKGKQ